MPTLFEVLATGDPSLQPKREDEGVKERPITFTASMVRAILAGTKTQTRRIVKPQPVPYVELGKVVPGYFTFAKGGLQITLTENLLRQGGGCSYGKVGDELWVRETFRVLRDEKKNFALWYAADEAALSYWVNYDKGKAVDIDAFALKHQNGRVLPSVHMARWASRITLEIVSVRVERLQEISEADAQAEGIDTLLCCSAPMCECSGRNCPGVRNAFTDLWNGINGKKEGCDWDSDPWVWVLEVKRLEEE